MYHTNIINQQFSQKTLDFSRFFPGIPKTAPVDCIDNYLAGLTFFQKQIAYYLLGFRNASWATITNEHIATVIGCSTKTVTRATNKFLDDGFITKSQENKYAPNNYTINKVKFSFFHWFQSLSEHNQELYISHGIRLNHNNQIIYPSRNVPHNKSSLILDILSSKPCPVPVSSRAHARRYVYAHDMNDQKKGKKVNEAQKKLILDNRFSPTVKNMFNEPTIMEHIITPVIQKITAILSLDEHEQLKLTPFTDETLEHVYKKLERSVSAKKISYIHNRVGWIIAIANKYCTANNVKADWNWYYDLCEIKGVNPNTQARPLTLDNKQKKDSYKGKIGSWQRNQQILPLQDRVDKWKSEIAKLQKMLESFTGADNFNLKGLLIKSIENVHKELEEAEHLLRKSGDEKQVISDRYNPYTMETTSA